MGFLNYLLFESYLTILSLVSCFAISLPKEMLAYCNAEISWPALSFKPVRLDTGSNFNMAIWNARVNAQHARYYYTDERFK